MKTVKEFLNLTFPPEGNGLRTYEIFGISKPRSIELKNILDKINRKAMAPALEAVNALPNKLTEKDRARVQSALDGVVAWTAPRPFLTKVLAECPVRDENEAAYVVFAFTFEMFNRIQTNQNYAVEVNNRLLSIREDKKPEPPKPPKNG